MTIKDIVLHQGPDSRSQARLEAAICLAKAHDAHIIGVYVQVFPGAPEFGWVAFGKEGMARLRSNIENETVRAGKAFRSRTEEEGVASEWRIEEGNPTDAIMICARYGDLTVISQANPEESSYEGSMPDHLVLGAGGPVLVVPYIGKYGKIGRRVMIAWNGTREAARAVRDSMPLLRRAEKVIVYSVDSPSHHTFSGADICARLSRHGISAEAEQILRGAESEAVAPSLKTVGDFGSQEPGAWSLTRHPSIGEIGVGDALLSAVTDFSIDLLVMGAYGHSRIRELVLGGATRQILKTMTVPVVFSN